MTHEEFIAAERRASSLVGASLGGGASFAVETLNEASLTEASLPEVSLAGVSLAGSLSSGALLAGVLSVDVSTVEPGESLCSCLLSD